MHHQLETLGTHSKVIQTSEEMSKVSGQASLKAHLFDFACSTSVRGIPRIVRADDKVLSVFWTFCVLLASGMLLSSIYYALSDYYSYGRLTNIKEADYNAAFPYITLCKTSQLNELSTDTMDYTEYFTKLQSYKKELPYAYIHSIWPTVTQQDYDEFWSHYMSKSGYFSYLPLDVNYAQTNESKNNPFTLFCQASKWDETSSWDCSSAISNVWNPQFYKCSSIKLPDKLTKLVKRILLVLYLNDFDQPFVKYDSSADGDGSSTTAPGVWMGVDEAVSTTNIGLSIAPGTSATVIVTQVDRKRLEKPFDNCDTREFLGNESDNIPYSAPACQSLCIQKKRIDDCKCVESRQLYTSEMLNSVNQTICGNLTSLNENMTADEGLMALNISNCLSNSSKTSPETCIETCIHSCDDRDYEATVSASGPWPHPSFQRDFYDVFIRGSNYSNKFEPYRKIIDAFDNGSLSQQEAMRQFGSIDLIAKNFIQLEIIISHQKPFIVSDRPEMTTHDLVSSFGGFMSLWLGVTTMFGFEVLELFYRIARSYLHRKITMVKPQT